MPRKGKTTKHTAKEIQAKIDAHKDKGGGASGIARRRDTKPPYFCLVCRTPQPSLKSLSQHFEGKHAKIEMTPDKYEVDPGHTNHERELKKYHAEKSGVAVSGGAGGGGSRGGGGRGGGGRGKGKPKGNKGGPGAGKSLVPKRR